jgi:hypothetical protein
MILAGIVVGIYIGVWIMFIKGIVQIIEGAKYNPVNAIDIGFGIFRVLCSTVVGWLSTLLLVTPGFMILTKRKKYG